MKPKPLLRRPLSSTSVLPPEPVTEYLRLQLQDELDGKHLFLGAGGTLDVLSPAHGGLGLGRIAYSPGLRAAVKKGREFVYRFTIPEHMHRGDTFSVTIWGHDRVPQMRFLLEVG